MELCELPYEVLGMIANFCPQHDLCALSRTCELVHGHALPALYRSIVIEGEEILNDLGRFYIAPLTVARNLK